MNLSQLQTELPSPFYRVAAKALVFDGSGRLLVTKNEDSEWEIPGGGLEYDESPEECLRRELLEEATLKLVSLGKLKFQFTGVSKMGWHVIRFFYDVIVEPGTPRPDDDMVDFAYVTQEELVKLTFTPADAPIKDYVDQIWPPTIEKAAVNL